MAWTTPKTWSSEPLTSIDLNTYVRDNQNHLKDRLDSGASASASGSSNISTTSTEFVDADADQLSLSLTTHGGDVLLGFTGTVQNSANGATTSLNVAVDGVNFVGNDGVTRHGIARNDENNRYQSLSFVILIRGLSPGAHTFNLRWKTTANNTATIDIVSLHPQFWAKEI